MRTTIAIRDDLLLEAKRRALSRPKEPANRAPPVRLQTFRGQGLRPGVDLDHSAALLDIMEE